MAPVEPRRSGRPKRIRAPDDYDSSPAQTPPSKKRRFNSLAASSPSTPRGFSAIASAIGGHLGLGGRKSANDKDLADVDEALYDIPDSDGVDGEDQSLDIETVSPEKSTPSKKNVYDIPDSGGEPLPKRRGRPPKASNKVNKPISKAPAAVACSPNRNADTARRSETPLLKGILTPQKRKVGRPRKSVVFDAGVDKDGEIYFEDLPTKATKSKGREKGADKAGGAEVETHTDGADQAVEEGDGESEDDEVCAICSEPDSEPPNEIIFCDNCDMAVHQKCYDVPAIPEGDWICRNCSQEDTLPSVQAPITSKGASIKPSKLPSIPNFETHLNTMQRVLLDRCSGIRRLKLRGQVEAYEKVYQLIEQTVLAGEGNSMMVIGARGCGKTIMVEEVLSDLKTEHFEEFHVVHLNGFIHTDDKLALKEIWRQLGKEMDVEDDPVAKTNNYADTMASLLALLSHPADITGAADGITSKSVVFVIDEFDLFATHARQTLLYNLFDIAQARKAPIAVLGLTNRIGVVESLEKRVKSRFSHRYVYMSLPKTLPSYWDICKQGLAVDEEDLEAEGFDVGLKGLYEFRKFWDTKIETLRKTSSFEDHLEFCYYTAKSVSAFLTSCIIPLSTLSATSLDLGASFGSPDLVSLESPEAKHHLLAALSDLELAMLVSAARLDIVAHTDTVNFAMAYDEYTSQMGRQRVQSATSGMLAMGAGARVWGRGVAAVAWERLVSLGLLIPAGMGGRSNAIHGGLEGKMWKLDVGLEEIPSAVELPGYLAKWCSQI